MLFNAKNFDICKNIFEMFEYWNTNVVKCIFSYLAYAKTNQKKYANALK